MYEYYFYILAQTPEPNGKDDVSTSLIEIITNSGTFGLLAFIVIAAIYAIPKLFKAFLEKWDATMKQITDDRHAGNNALHEMGIKLELENAKQRAHDFQCLQQEREICDKHFEKLSASLEKSQESTANALLKLSDSHILLADTVKNFTSLIKKDSHA